MLRVEESDSSDSEKCEKKEYVVEEGSSIFPLMKIGMTTSMMSMMMMIRSR